MKEWKKGYDPEDPHDGGKSYDPDDHIGGEFGPLDGP